MTEILEYCDKKVIVNIRRDNTTNKPQYYAVLQNPYKHQRITEVIFGTNGQIVKNKCLRQLKKWRIENGN